MDVPIIRTRRLILRGLRVGDWDAYPAMNADPRCARGWAGRC